MEQHAIPLPDGGQLAFTLHIRPRSRSMRIRLLPPDGRVEVTVPPRHDLSHVCHFVQSKITWIRRWQKRFAEQQKVPAKDPLSGILLPRALPLLYLGGDFSISYAFRSCSWVAAKCDPAAKTITVTGNVLNADAVRNALADLLKRCAAEYIVPHLEGVAGKFAFKPGKCTVRIQKGRWGSCSAKESAISLNAMLLFLPDEIVEYILIHELCHLRQMNHSPLFWKEVEKYCPDYAVRRHKLRKMEKTLPGYFCEK